MNPQLHAFFLDPSASGHFMHAELSEAYRRACEQAGAQHELIAYTDEFAFLLDEIPELLRDENEYPEYTDQLADFRTALRSIDARRAQVADLHIEVGQRLDRINNLIADAYLTPGQPIDDYGYESWCEARDRTLAEVERLRSAPEISPHLDRALTNIDELANAIPANVSLGDLPYFTTPVDPHLHAFFLDPSSFPHDLHPDISARYSALCAQLEADDPELLVYADSFMDFFNHVRAIEQQARQNDPNHPYTAHLTHLWAATYAVFHRSTRVQDLNDIIAEDLRAFRGAEAAAVQDDIPLTESHTFPMRLAEARTALETVEQYSSYPLLTPHIERSLTSLEDLRNILAAHTPLEPARATAPSPAPDPDEAPPADAAASTSTQPAPEPAPLAPGADTPQLIWAGIGSRGNDREPMPPSVLADMTELARRMAAAGWHLSSGGADGSDTAFANGTPVDQRTIWLPWPGYNDLSGPDCHPIPRDRLQQSLELAERLHPAWHKCSPGMRKLHARNGLILLGRNLDKPVHAVVAYTQGGKLQGGTAQGLRIAMEHGIPIFNLGSMTMEEAWKGLQELRQSLTAAGPRTAAAEHSAPSPASPSATRNYDPAASCVFRFSRDEWGPFSNFYPSIRPIAAAGHKFATSEHVYQAAKFRESPDIQASIAGASSARNAADMGRNTGNRPDADWNDRRVNAMRWVIRMKREANPELVDGLLKKSGDRPIVEHSNHDSFWGARPQGDKLVGQNILGRLWIELRQQVRDGDPRALASALDDPISPKAVARARAVETIDVKLPPSLGLVTNHRRLLEAAQDGWLRPLEGKSFLLAGDGSVSEDLAAGDNPIPVRLTFDPGKFPFPALRRELAAAGAEAEAATPLAWRSPIPLSAVIRMEVAAEEQKTRLPAMAAQFGNVTLPAVEIAVNRDLTTAAAGRPASTSDIPALQLPERLNAIQGALAMAAATLPKEERWSEVLQHVLNAHPSRPISDPANNNADWFSLPWIPRSADMPAQPIASDQRRLWDAAMSCLRWPAAEGKSPAALAERIAGTASETGPNPAADRWLEQTQKIIAADASINPTVPFVERAGVAIQLALLRPDPDRFKSWNTALPELPDSVLWAGATLCGWRHGYLELGNTFRGDATMQETVANAALAAAVPSAYAPTWATEQKDAAALPDTWQRIKIGYTSLYRAAGDQLQHLPYQEGFSEFRDFVAAAVDDRGCPQQHQARLTGLHHTLETQGSRHDAVHDAHTRLDDVGARLDDLKEKMSSEPGQTIETMPGYTGWLRDRDAAVAHWRELAADPAHKEHMQILAPDMMAPQIAELSDEPLRSIHRPSAEYPVPSSGQSVYTPSLQPLSHVYDRALAFVDREPALLPYAPQFDELKTAVSNAIDECRHAPDLLDMLTTLRTTLEDSHQCMTRAKAATEDVANASQALCTMKTRSERSDRPVHEAPGFKNWRDDADRALRQYDAATRNPALAPHLARADSLGVLAETAVPMLRDPRFQAPVASEASLAASRQRSEQAEEQHSMSA